MIAQRKSAQEALERKRKEETTLNGPTGAATQEVGIKEGQLAVKDISSESPHIAYDFGELNS